MTWTPSLGAAIVTHSYTASGENQISLLIGDQFEIFDECEGWYHGKNVLTGIEGIFPKCCVYFIPTTTFDQRKLLIQTQDLIQIEARLSISYALDFILNSDDCLLVCRAADCIGIIIQKIFSLQSIEEGQEEEIAAIHTDLSKSIDMLRDVLNIPYVLRTKLSEYPTFTTWGDEQFIKTTKSIQKNVIKNPDYAMIRIVLETMSPKKYQYYRIALYQPMRYPFITLPTFRLVGPNHPKCNVIFSSLEKKDLKNPTYLIVYVYDIEDENEQVPVNTTSSKTQRAQSTVTPVSYNLDNPQPRQLATNREGVDSLNSIFNQYTNQRRFTAAPGEFSNLNLPNDDVRSQRRNTGSDIQIPQPKTKSYYMAKLRPRNIVGCAIFKLPSCKTDLAFKRSTSTFTTQIWASTEPQNMYSFHEPYALNQQWIIQTLKPVSEIKVHYTPFFGQQLEFLERESANIKSVVEPLFLPSVLPAKSMVSRLIFSVNKIAQHSGKKSRLLVHVLDKSQNKFLSIIERPFSRHCNSDTWKSLCFKGAKMLEINFEETFTIDIASIPEDKLKDIYIAVEIQRYLIIENIFASASYATIPIANNEGQIREAHCENVQFHHFPFKHRHLLAKAKEFAIPAEGRDGGTFEYSLILSSTLLTINEALYKLIHYERFPDDIEYSLKNFDSGGLSEYSQFIKEILNALLIIIVTRSEYATLAFDKMTNFLATIFTRARPDYRHIIDEFLSSFFTPAFQKTINHRGALLYENLVPRLTSAILGDSTQQTFRDVLKCSSYYVHMSVKSMAIALRVSSNPVTGSKLFALFDSFFKRLNKIVSDYPNDKNDLQKNGSLFTNQLLVLQQFGRIALPLLYCFKSERVAKVFAEFIDSVRFFPEDKKQIAIDKAKFRILLSLAFTKCWSDDSSRSVLMPVYTRELKKTASLPHCIPFIVPILSNLFFNVRNDFIFEFIPVLTECYQQQLELSKKSKSQTIISNAQANMLNIDKLILIMAYTIPEKVPFDISLKLIQKDSIGAKERLFVLSNVLHKLAKVLKTSTTDDQKIDILKIYLDLAIEQNKTSENCKIDDLLYNVIYPQKSAYGACKEIFYSLQSNQDALLSFIKPIFHCYINDESQDLISIYMTLVGMILSNEKEEMANRNSSNQLNIKSNQESSIKPNAPKQPNDQKDMIDQSNPMIQTQADQDGAYQFLFNSTAFNKSPVNTTKLLRRPSQPTFENAIDYYKKDSILDKSFTAAFELIECEQFPVIGQMYKYVSEHKTELTNEVLKFFELFNTLITSLKVIREFVLDNKRTLTDEEIVSNSINNLINFCYRTKNVKILIRLLFTQAHIQMSVKNNIESVSSFIEFLKYIPCNTDEVDSLYQIENVTTGLELHTHILLKCIDLCKTCNYEEIGLDIVKRIKETIIKPYKYYELMKPVLEKESDLYSIISTNDRNYNTFFLVHFIGDVFEPYNCNKMFIYKRQPDFSLDSMKQEIEGRYPNITCSTEILSTCKTYIFVAQTTVTNESELANPYVRPMLTTKGMHGCKYHIKYLLYKNAHLFKAELPAPFNIQTSSFLDNDCDSLKCVRDALTTGTKQLFYHTKESFPSISTRIEVIMEQNSSRVTNPIDTVILYIRRRSFNMMSEVLNFKKIYDSSLSDSTNSVILSFLSKEKQHRSTGQFPLLCSQGLKKAQENGSVSKFFTLLDSELNDSLSGQGKYYADAFLKYITQKNCPGLFNPNKHKLIIDSLKELMNTYFDAISIGNKIKNDDNEEILKNITSNFKNYQAYINNLISQ